MENQVCDRLRTRFAPNVTGRLHLGNARTALFTYLWAQANGAEFWIRLDDDPFYQPMPGSEAQWMKGEHEKQIIEDLHWLGLEFDGHYRLSERRGLALWIMDNFKDESGLRPGTLLKDVYLIPENQSTVAAVVTGLVDDVCTGVTVRGRGRDIKNIENAETAICNIFGWDLPESIWFPVLGSAFEQFHKSANPKWTIARCREMGMSPDQVRNTLFFSAGCTVNDVQSIDLPGMVVWYSQNEDRVLQSDFTVFDESLLQRFSGG